MVRGAQEAECRIRTGPGGIDVRLTIDGVPVFYKRLRSTRRAGDILAGLQQKLQGDGWRARLELNQRPSA
jgi:hypothetical protein